MTRRVLRTVLVVVLVGACTSSRDRLRGAEAWADAVPIVYPTEPQPLKIQLEKLLGMWEFRHGPDATDPAILNIYDRNEPAVMENLVGRVRIEPGAEPGTAKVTAIGVRARGYSWDYRYRVDEKVHEKLGTFFHG